MVSCLIILLMKKFTNVVIPFCFGSSIFDILCMLTFCNDYIVMGRKNHLVIDDNCNIVNF